MVERSEADMLKARGYSDDEIAKLTGRKAAAAVAAESAPAVAPEVVQETHKPRRKRRTNGSDA